MLMAAPSYSRMG